LDVTDPEPIFPDNPLLTLDNVIITPHVAGFTAEGRRRSQVAAVEQVLAALRGGPMVNLLNPWKPRSF
jgi:phosphoglycerate dehydrogenase-like enzyme